FEGLHPPRGGFFVAASRQTNWIVNAGRLRGLAIRPPLPAAFEMPVMPMASTGRRPSGSTCHDVGLLHDCRERLLGQPARLQEAGEIASLAKLWDAQIHCAGARRP